MIQLNPGTDGVQPVVVNEGVEWELCLETVRQLLSAIRVASGG
jgi:hypothetical protein